MNTEIKKKVGICGIHALRKDTQGREVTSWLFLSSALEKSIGYEYKQIGILESHEEQGVGRCQLAKRMKGTRNTEKALGNLPDYIFS